MRVVLLKPSYPRKSGQSPCQLVPVQDPEISNFEWQISVTLGFIREY